ncbi:MAG: TRAP transporter small permease [Lachnospiraceae bacterium]|nr:TRAP transporter small permease [Lachnospiraceae bacterium]
MKGLKWLDQNFELAILALLLAVMSVLSFANVIMRYCFHNALSWSDEVCCYCLALSAFFSLPCAIRMGSSIRVDTFTTMLPQGVQRALHQICNVVMIGFLAYLLKGTLGIIANSAKVGQASPALRIPLAQIYSVMAFAVMLGILRYVQMIILGLKHKETEGGEA